MTTKLLLIFALFFSTLHAFGQNSNFWEKTSVNGIAKSNIIDQTTRIEKPNYYSLDEKSISSYLLGAPNRYKTSKSSVRVEIPNPDGKMDVFEIFSAQTMSKELAKSLPKVKSYVGYNVSDKSHSLRITLTPQGLYAMTLGSEHGQTFINPYAKDSNTYILFSKNNAYKDAADAFECGVTDTHLEEKSTNTQKESKFIEDGVLRKYRLGVAATGEYSQFHWQAAGLAESASDADKKDAVQAAIVVSIDRINQIFERDFGVTLELIANNKDVIYLDASTDPYTRDHRTMIDENQVVFDDIIESGNYDIGHVYSTLGGGIAFTPSVCNNNVKAGGSTGLNSPVGDPFSIDIAAHEFGHQFGANHTQNSDVNRNDATAVEPGSGSTIMSYAGVAPPNVQNQSDAMFHYTSIMEITNRFSGSTGSCAQEISIANQAPVVQALSNYTIPKNTPFSLEAIASDADGDALTYSWDQIDNEIAPMPPESNSTGGPSFRTFLPSNSPTRYFPSMSTLLENNYSNTWEVLATVNRNYNFGVVVRDNNPLGGQISTQTTTLTVDDTAGPFRVTSQPGSNIIWGTNDTETITWDVTNTSNSSGINAQNVDILLSTDNGQNFDIVLASNTANDGSKDIVVPDIISSNSRLMVKASENIFFDLNEANIVIEDSGITCTTPQDLNVSNITNNSVDISWTASTSNPANGYEYVLITDDATPDASTTPTGTVGAGVTTATATGLFGNATYEVYLRSNCGGDLSVWSTSRKFTTTCNISIAPYSENFDDTDWEVGSTSSNYGDCWNRNPSDDTSSYAWTVGSGSTPTAGTGPSDDFSGGGKYLYTEASNGLENDLAVLNAPPIDLSSLTVPRMIIRYHMFGSTMGTFKVQVKDINASIYNTIFEVTGQQQIETTDSFLDEILDLTAYAGQTINIRFVGLRGGGESSDIAIDEFTIKENDCVTPQNLISSYNFSTNYVDLEWDATTNESDGYEWVIMANGAAPDTANAFATGTTTSGTTLAQATELNSDTTYDAYVRSDCGKKSFSGWSTVSNFFTGYCAAGGNGANDSSLYEKISNVSFNTIDNTSDSTDGYEDFTSISTILSISDSYTFTASTTEFYTTSQIIVWIDFNQNGDFTDEGEEFIIPSIEDLELFTKEITIPTGAALGKTRMRVRLHDTQTIYGPNDTPCGDSDYGQVEDYTVVIYDDYVHYENAWTPANPSGVSTGTDNVLVVDGQTFLSGTTALNDLTVQFNGQLNVEGVLQAQGDITNNGKLVFQSNSTTTGQLDSFTGNISGAVEVQRYVNPRRAFRLYSPTVTTLSTIYENLQENGAAPSGFGTHITGTTSPANGFDVTATGNPSMFQFDNSVENQSGGAAWSPIANTNVNTLSAGEPLRLLVRGDRTTDLTTNDPPANPTVLRAQGNIHTGDYSPSISAFPNNYNFVGNPYQAVVDVNALTFSGDINSTYIYAWDPLINAFGGFVTITVADGDTSVTSSLDQNIQPGQAFFIRNNETVNTTPSITFTEASKSTGEQQVNFKTQNLTQLNLQLFSTSSKDEHILDAVGLRFGEDFNTKVDDADAGKMGNSGENFALVNSNQLLSIEQRKFPRFGEELQLFANNYKSENYKFKIQKNNWLEGVDVFIKDNYLGTQTLIDAENEFSFSIDPAISESKSSLRFSLVFKNQTLSNENFNGNTLKIYPNPTSDVLHISGIKEEVSVQIFDLLGKKVMSIDNVNNNQEFDVQSFSSGVYLVKVKGDHTNFSKKIIKQ